MRLTLSLCKYLGKGPRRAGTLRPRMIEKVFNNRWQVGRDLKVTDAGYKDACLERGIPVYKPEDIFTSHLPGTEDRIDFDFERLKTIKKPFESEEDHPYYQERTSYSFTDRTKYPVNLELNHAKVLLKTVEIKSGLPERLISEIVKYATAKQDDQVCRVIKDTQMFDATQKLLPYNYNVPYIGWNSVNDKMSSRTPYEPTMSWQYKTRREYGIPIKRKNMNLLRGLFGVCDINSSSDKAPNLLFRLHLESNLLRQFIDKDNRLLRFFVPLPYVVTDTKPLEPYGDAQATLDVALPDISPLNPFVCLWPKQVYNPQQNFPIKESVKKVGEHFVHTCVDLYNAHIPLRTPGGYHANSLTLGFVTALGQARNIYGSNISGVLPKPVTVHFITTDGRKYHFSVFQLNTLDLNGTDGIKNIFWHEPELEEMYEICGYEKAVPTLKGYNPNVFDKIQTMYLQ